MPLRLQVTSYTCGGFSIAWNTDHALVDAASFSMFVMSWSEIAQMRPLSRYPDHHRSVFKPRSPLKLNPSLDRTFSKYTMEDLLNAMPANKSNYDISVKRFYFVEASDIDLLQAQASQDGRRATKVEAFSAYLWKILAGLILKDNEFNRSCKMAWLVDGRRRMASYKVPNLFGNLLSMAVGEASVQELSHSRISSVASMVQNAIAEASKEAHFLDLLDWIEFHRPGMFLAKVLLGLGGPAIVLSDARRLPVKELDFGFGRPVFGSVYTTAPKLGAGYVSPQLSGVGDGSWVVFTILWPELVEALESDPNRIFKPMSATRLGF
ncbi:hypothetical protein Sjap_020050 [Stephania japonica]|uniref:Uncharacterized protein n=1 Tax=Stephania japonica TaxID=461633 RepID=A0AAP0HZX9_9MAGN